MCSAAVLVLYEAVMVQCCFWTGLWTVREGAYKLFNISVTFFYLAVTLCEN